MNGRLTSILAGALLFAGRAQAACPTAEPILGPLTCSSVTAGRVDYSGTSSLGGTRPSSNSYQCDDGASETGQVVEDVYQFTCPQTGTVTIDLTGLDCDLDLFVIDSTCDPDPGCEAGSLAIGTGSETVDISCVAGDLKYIVVEGWGFGITSTEPGYCSGAAAGDYTISFDTTAGTGCGEDCDNGSDDDADGFADCDDTDCAAETVCDYDRDNDGYDGTAYGGTDCNDSNSAVSPGAAEVCNSVDDDCDGTTDESTATDARTYYRDADGDSYGSSATSTRGCSAPSGYVSTATDCDDTRSTVNPAATETCDSLDNDCDGATDESGGSTWYRDADSDGYGTSTTTTISCSAPVGYVSNSTDCNDSNAAVSPGDAEICNSVDDDCDGSTDESGGSTWYADTDSDGYGESTSTRVSCSAPTGYVSNSTDCNDRSSTVHPGATEYCNGTDDDCDSSTDEAGAADESTWYVDADGDSYGTTTSTRSCNRPSGYASSTGDCNDGNSAIYPGATEICDGADNDCDSRTDESGGSTWYADTDADGYGDATVATVSCTAPTGYVSSFSDCDDDIAAVNPAATEYCNRIDDDCDGTVDEDDAADVTAWYADADGDTYGDPNVSTYACDAPAAYVANSGDCYDDESAVNPTGTETADGVDEDCDGDVDEGTSSYDDDGDGYAESGGDCDDSIATSAPAATETCNGADDDCDGTVDEDTNCADDDRDGWTEDDGDCNDGDANVSPGTPEFDDNGIDDDCDGSVDGGIYDPDGDGYTDDGGDCGSADATTYPGADELPDGVDNDCDGVTDEGTTNTDDDGDGEAEVDGDCNDEDDSINTDATEIENGVDDDCDGQVDQGGEFTDDDGDGFSDAAGDCDDANSAISPASNESGNGLDDDCDGLIDEGTDDVDADGYTLEDGDCNDLDGWANPGLTEMCEDSVDNDCDGDVDEGCDVGPGDGEISKGGGICGGCSSNPTSSALVPLVLGLISLTLRRRRA